MTDKPDNPLKFWEELKRRKVVRVIPVYAAASFVLLELVDIIGEPFGLPDWTLRFVFVLLSIGFVLAVILSWVYDITPEGVQKTKPKSQVSTNEKEFTSKGWKISTYVSILIITGFVLVSIIGDIKQNSDISKLEKTIAVLPFENWSYGEENAHLGNAIANEIITELYNIKEFHIRSYTSSSQYKGSDKPIPQIGIELDANFIIEGIIDRQDEYVNVHVQVIQANNDDHIWAHKFEGEWKDIHEIQDEVAFKVADELKTILSPNEIESIERKPTENQEAYNYYLRGNDYRSHGFEEQNYSNAINMYQLAIELDPDFALAYINLSRANLNLYHFHFDRSFERIVKSKEAIDMAFTIDPDMPEAYYALGQYYYMGFRNYPKALEQANIALKYRPNNTDWLSLVGSIYRRMGNINKALENYHIVFENNPRSDFSALNIAGSYFLINKYSEALYYFNLSIDLSPDFVEAYLYKIHLFLKWEGNTVNAWKTLDEASIFVDPTTQMVLVEMTVLLDIYKGNYKDALVLLKDTNFETFYTQFYYYPKSLYYAIIYDLMNDRGNAEHYYNSSVYILDSLLLDSPEDSRLYSSLGISYAGLGYEEKALTAGKKGTEILPISKEAWQGYYRAIELAQIYVMIGEYELALEQLDLLLSIPGELSAKLLQLDPKWKPLWNLTEFKQLIDKYSNN